MRKADNLPPSCAIVTKSGNLHFLEPSGSLWACNGTDFKKRFISVLSKLSCLLFTVSKYGGASVLVKQSNLKLRFVQSYKVVTLCYVKELKNTASCIHCTALQGKKFNRYIEY